MKRHATTLVGIAVSLAMSVSLAWQTVDWLRLVRTPGNVDPLNTTNTPAPTSNQRLDQLFGASGTDSRTPPATSLRLTLLGSFVHADPKRSTAIIRLESDPAQLHAIDSEVASGVRLHAVYADRVELMRNGRLETLAFPHSQSADDSANYSPSAGTLDTLDQLDDLEADNLSQLRERMDALRQQMEAAGTLPPDTEPTEQPTESD
jgi:general secretion pathway protein C